MITSGESSDRLRARCRRQFASAFPNAVSAAAAGHVGFQLHKPETVLDAPNPPMSPFQALFLSLSLVDQKLINPDYQAPPEEWDRDFYPRLLQQARTYRELQRRIAAGEVKPEFKATLQVSTAKEDIANETLSAHCRDVCVGRAETL
jgi:hypothetical protein